MGLLTKILVGEINMRTGDKESIYRTSLNIRLNIFSLLFCDAASIEGRKEMFYLTMHSTHFYLRLYGVRHMVKDHSNSKRGNTLLPLSD